MEKHPHDEHSEKDHPKMGHEYHDHSKMRQKAKGHSGKDHHHGLDHGHNPAHGQMGHDHHKMMVEDFKKRFWVSTIISIPILLLSPMIQDFFGYDFILPGNPYVLFALSTFVYFWGAGLSLRDFTRRLNPGVLE